jgi:hypothetical protein
MLDIVEIKNGQDLVLVDSVVSKAANVLSVQLGELEYARDFGVDFRFFLDTDLKFQTEAFKSYLIQRLTESQVNVSEALEIIEPLVSRYVISVSELQSDTTGLII